MTGLSDSFQRPINYLRISVTDRCNLRCTYCMPANGVSLMPRSDILSYEEIHAVVAAAAEAGVNKVRITGGEPLVRAGLADLIAMLAHIDAIDDISLTTNGTLLAQQAAQLKGAGLRRVNISLDTFRPDRFTAISRLGNINEALKGIEVAREVGLNPVKINMVVMAGINDDELVDFAARTISEDWHVRFIELMPFGNRETSSQFVSVSEMRRRLEVLGTLEPAAMKVGNGPAKYFRLPNARGTIGFITPVSEHFCFRCNRLRLTADGKLRLCLMSEQETDLRQPLRNGASPDDLKRLIQEAVNSKPLCHHLAQGQVPQGRRFSQIGG